MNESGMPSDAFYAILYEDLERCPEYFIGAGARDIALKRFEIAKLNWTCHLVCEYTYAEQLEQRLERAEKDDAGNVSTEGNGKVSVSVKNIVQSSKVQRQVEAVKEIALDSPDDCVRVPRAVLECFKRSHYYCPDSWYTCPKHPDGCCNDDAGEECNCGVEQWNAQIEVLLAAAPGEGKR